MADLMDGRQLALKVAANQAGMEAANKMMALVRQKFDRVFPGGKFPADLKHYDQQSFELLEACKNELEPAILDRLNARYGAEPLLLNFLNYLVNRSVCEERQDLSTGQSPKVYIASTSQVNNTRFFGDEVFGCAIEVNCKGENDNMRPGVPFRYADGHGFPLEVAMFMQAFVPENKKGHDFEGRVEAAHRIYRQFIKNMRKTHYYGDNQYSLRGSGIDAAFQNVQVRTHVHSPTHHGNDHARKHVPLIPCVYDGRDGVVKMILSRKVNGLDGKMTREYNTEMSVRRFIQSAGLDAEPYFALILEQLSAMEGNLYYPKIIAHDHSIKDIECVDRRRRKSKHDYGRLIKEIGSHTSKKQMLHQLESPFVDANVEEGHGNCGYNNTVLACYLAFKELGEKTDANPKLLMNKLARAILKRIDDGGRSPLDQRQFEDALAELHSNGIYFNSKTDKDGHRSVPTEDFLRALICGGADDTRETVGQALKGEGKVAVIDSRGYLVMPAAMAVEEVAKELLPNGLELNAEHFDYLLTEEVTRRIIAGYRELVDKYERATPFELTGRMADLHTDFMFMLADRLPQNIDQLFDMGRQMYYKPEMRQAPGIDLTTKPFMTLEELKRYERGRNGQ